MEIIGTNPYSEQREVLYRQLKQQLQGQWVGAEQVVHDPLHSCSVDEPATTRRLTEHPPFSDLLQELDELTISSAGWMRRFERLGEELAYLFAESHKATFSITTTPARGKEQSMAEANEEFGVSSAIVASDNNASAVTASHR